MRAHFSRASVVIHPANALFARALLSNSSWPLQCYFHDSVQKRKARYEDKVTFQSVLNGKFGGAAPQKAVSVRVVAKIAR